jgi:cytoskeleton protein RodZ
MTDIGAKLRRARERRGLSLAQMAAKTKIPVAALDAIERNELSRLPGGIFRRGFVRTYALEAGLDPDQTVDEMFAAAGDVPLRQAAQALPDKESEFESDRRIARVVLTLVAISIPLIIAILYFTLR